MTTPTAAVCPNCRGPIAVEYARLGATCVCPHCRSLTVPVVPAGGAVHGDGDHLTYADFYRLVDGGDDECRGAVEPLLWDWYGLRVDRAGAPAVLRRADGAAVDKLWLHLAVQADAGRRGTLYRAAMTLWR
jgi:hypothetical protein